MRLPNCSQQGSIRRFLKLDGTTILMAGLKEPLRWNLIKRHLHVQYLINCRPTKAEVFLKCCLDLLLYAGSPLGLSLNPVYATVTISVPIHTLANWWFIYFMNNPRSHQHQQQRHHPTNQTLRLMQIHRRYISYRGAGAIMYMAVHHGFMDFNSMIIMQEFEIFMVQTDPLWQHRCLKLWISTMNR
uniref:Uncharacterized protein n=1 Tax=Glossina austeni TaxID=7395 RepID=A0A1A9VV49_GLOAU